MRLQDSINLLSSNLKNLANFLGTIFVPIVSALIIFIFGIIIASILRKFWQEIARILNFEKTLQRFSNYTSLTKFDKSTLLTEIVSFLIWWSTVLVFSFSALQILGINLTHVFKVYANIIPNIVLASAFLLVGLLFAYFTYLIIGALGALLSFPAFLWVARFIALAVIVMSIIFSLTSLGISSEMLRFIEIGAIAALALASALALKDFLLDLLKKVRTLVK